MSRLVILGAGIAGHTAALIARRWLAKEHEVCVVSVDAADDSEVALRAAGG